MAAHVQRTSLTTEEVGAAKDERKSHNDTVPLLDALSSKGKDASIAEDASVDADAAADEDDDEDAVVAEDRLVRGMTVNARRRSPGPCNLYKHVLLAMSNNRILASVPPVAINDSDMNTTHSTGDSTVIVMGKAEPSPPKTCIDTVLSCANA
jgi:hypothetical protein